MSGPHCLAGLTFSAIGHAPVDVAFFAADSVAAVPEGSCDPAVARVFQESGDFTAFDFVSCLHAKLKIVTLIVNGPGFVRFHQNAVFGVSY